MIRDALQCCYSNITTAEGGSATGGWKPLAVSAGIPTVAYKRCVRMQTDRSVITRFGNCRDENGQILNLMELIAEDGYLFFLRTQFGLRERAHGREINFSHALIFPYADREQIRDPNFFLTILNENFKYTPEEAIADQGTLVRGKPFVLNEALDRCGIDAEKYSLLMECIYQKMTDWMVKEPLYVWYDGTEEHMRTLLYCIYMGLPYGLRRRFSAGPAPADVMQGKSVIFTRRIRGRSAYIDPRTGENNVLNANREARIRKLGFVTWVPEHFENSDFEIDRYYSQLEELALRFGDISASDERVLKIAHSQMQDIPLAELTEEELFARIGDALNTAINGNEAIDGIIAALMDEIRNRNRWMSDQNEKQLEKRLQVTRSEVLKAAADAWQFYSFSGRFTADEMAAQLKKMPLEKFEEYRERLKKSETGMVAIDKYYLARLREEPDPSMERLQEFIKELMAFDMLWELPETKKEIDQLGRKRYLQNLEREIPKKEPKLIQNYDALISILGGLYGENELPSCKEWARNEIWKRIDFTRISFEARDQYMDSKIVLLGNDRCLMYISYIKLPDELRCEVNEPDFLKKYRGFFHKYSLSVQTDEGKAAHETMMKRLKDKELYSDENFTIWCYETVDLPLNALKLVLSIYSAWKDGQSANMAEGLWQITEKSKEFEITEEHQKRLADFLLNLCVTMDSTEETVTLDTWLAIAGFSSLRNSFDFFRLFDERRNGRCYFLKDENYDIISCERFREERFRLDAAEYAVQKVPEADTVKKWLKDLQKWEKSEKTQAKKNRKQERKKEIKKKNKQNPEDEIATETLKLEETALEERQHRGEELPKHPENEIDVGSVAFFADKAGGEKGTKERESEPSSDFHWESGYAEVQSEISTGESQSVYDSRLRSTAGKRTNPGSGYIEKGIFYEDTGELIQGKSSVDFHTEKTGNTGSKEENMAGQREGEKSGSDALSGQPGKNGLEKSSNLTGKDKKRKSEKVTGGGFLDGISSFFNRGGGREN